MPICYLHAGTHKTGTSSVQAFLAANHEPLRRRGVLAPRAGMTEGGSHLRLVEELLGRLVAPRFAGAVEKLRDELASDPGHDVVISAEDMESMLGQGDGVSPIVAFFRKAGYDVQILLYFRNQPQYLNSSYAQRVRIFSLYGDFRSTLDEAQSHRRYRYSRWLENAARNGCELIARPFDAEMRRNGVVDDVLETVGARRGEDDGRHPFAPVPRTNIGVGPRAVALARDLMMDLAGRGVTLTQAQRIRIRGVYDRWREGAGAERASYSGLDDGLVRRIEAYYRDDNDAFAHQVWGRRWAEVFADEVGRPCTPNEFDLARAAPDERAAYDQARRYLMTEIERILANPAFKVDKHWDLRRAGRGKKASLLR